MTSYFFELFGPVTDMRGNPTDMKHAKQIIVGGRNIYVSWSYLLLVLREARAAGTGMVLVDSVHHRTAGLCDQFWQPRSGGDFALAMATERLQFERGWTHGEAARWPQRRTTSRAGSTTDRRRSSSIGAWGGGHGQLAGLSAPCCRPTEQAVGRALPANGSTLAE